jgi:hypothetical protein
VLSGAVSALMRATCYYVNELEAYLLNSNRRKSAF